MFVEHIVQRCLSKAPADRYPSMTALAQALGGAERALSRPAAEAALLTTPRRFARSGTIVVPRGRDAERDPTTLRAAGGRPRGRTPRRLVGVLLGAALLAGTGAVLMPRGDRDAIARVAPPAPGVAQPDVTAAPGRAAEVPRTDAPPEPARPEPGAGPDGAPHVATRESPLPSEPISTVARALAPMTDRQADVRPQPRTDRHTPTRTSTGDSHASRSARPANIDPMDLDRGD